MFSFLYWYFFLPQRVFDWVRLWLHCLWVYPKNFQGEDHRMCKFQVLNSNGCVDTFYFCSCGKFLGDVPKDVQERVKRWICIE